MADKCKSCFARAKQMMTNAETYDVCLLRQYPCDMIDTCDYFQPELKDLIQTIFDSVKVKYDYTDEQVLIYLRGYQDCIKDNQLPYEKKDTVDALYQALRLLKLAEDDMIVSGCTVCKYRDVYDDVCKNTEDCFVWRYADDVKTLLEKVGDTNERH